MVFYFSGTGNSLQVAKALSDSKNLLNISTTESGVFTADEIGFVFPVYCGVIPPFVEKFIKNSTFKADYIWAVVTCGGSEGKSFNHLQYLLLNKGEHLDYANHIVMPDNCIIFNTQYDTKQKQLNSVNGLAENIKNDIKMRKKIEISAKFSRVSSDFMWWGMRAFYGIKNKKTTNACNGCKTCVKLCPTDNIKLENGKISFGNNCAYCFACIHWCPQRAIKFGRLEINDKTSYINPSVNVAEMIDRNKKQK